MPKLTNPTDIARETFKQLATHRIASTPENHQRIDHEITGTSPNGTGETEKELTKALLAAGHDNPQRASTLKTIVQAIEKAIGKGSPHPSPRWPRKNVPNNPVGQILVMAQGLSLFN